MNKHISWTTKLKTYFYLGFINILRVAIYRVALKIRLHPVQYIKSSIASAPFFRTPEQQGKFKFLAIFSNANRVA